MKPSGIGGQAVIEGVMMRNGGEYAVAVRTPEGQIVVDKQKCSSHKLQNKKFAKLPIIRGVINFFDSMILGMKSLMYSASLFAEETEEEKAEREGKARKKAAEKAEKLRAQGKTAEAEQVLKKCEEKLAKEAGQLHAEAEKEKQKKDDDLLMTPGFFSRFSAGNAVFLPGICYNEPDKTAHILQKVYEAAGYRQQIRKTNQSGLQMSALHR